MVTTYNGKKRYFDFNKITNIYILICNDLYLFTLIFIETN